MRLPVVRLAVALVLAAGVGRCAAADLLAVYADALAADPQLALVRAQRGVQDEAAVQARAALLPQWNATAGDARSAADGTHARSVTSSIRQPLVDLGAWRSWDAARSALAAQDERLGAAAQDLRARVAQAYFGTLLAQAGVRTAAANEAAYAEQVRQADARVAAGLAASVDAEQARTYLELARGDGVRARQALDDARAALAQITGREAGALAPLAAALTAAPPAPASVQAWVDRALAANPQVRAQQRDLEAGEQRIAAARAAHAPTLGVGLDSVRRNDGAGTVSAVAVTLKLPLFAGGATESAVRQAAYLRDAQRESLEAERRAVAREVRAQFQAVSAGAALVQSTRAAVAAAERALASTRAGQALGTRTMTDLLLAIQTLAAAQNAHEQARHGWVIATLLLQRAAGGLGDAELEAANRLLQGDSR